MLWLNRQITFAKAQQVKLGTEQTMLWFFCDHVSQPFAQLDPGCFWLFEVITGHRCGICIIRQGQWRILLVQLRRTGTGWDVLSCVAHQAASSCLWCLYKLLDSLGFWWILFMFSWQNDTKVRCWSRVPWTIIKSLGICILLIHPYPSLHSHTATLSGQLYSWRPEDSDLFMAGFGRESPAGNLSSDGFFYHSWMVIISKN